jgi:hypothetical protein
MELNELLSHNLPQIILGGILFNLFLIFILWFLKQVFICYRCDKSNSREVTTIFNSSGGGYPLDGTQNITDQSVKVYWD